MNVLRDTDATVAAALGYSSQTAFAAAFRKLTSETTEQLATARPIKAISRQARQSLWGSGTHGAIEIVVLTATTRR